MPVFRPTGFPGIQVQIEPDETPAHFFSAVESDLTRIASGDIGGDLLDLIDKRSRGIGIGYAATDKYPNVTVCYAPGFAEAAAKTEARWDNYVRRKGRFGAMDRAVRASGGGHFMWVSYHPNPPGTTEGEIGYTSGQGLRTPPFIVLAHELIHAWHGMSGMMELKDKQTITAPDGRTYELAREEAFTVGLGSYANTRISENAIRAEHRLPRRTYYATANDFTAFAPLPFRPGHAPTGQELSQRFEAMKREWNDW
jgi:hypothetical protein